MNLTFAYNSGFVYIPEDRSDDTNISIIAQGVYSGVNFDFSITFYKPTVENVSYTITNITCSLPAGTSGTRSNSTYNITGNFSGIFGEICSFKMKDGSIKNLQINNTEDWEFIFKWTPPSTNEILVNYTFDVTSTDGYNTYHDTVVVPQYVYWKWSVSLASFKNTIAIMKAK